MNKKTKQELIEHLVYKYALDEKYLSQLSLEQLEELYQEKEKESLLIAKNPNKFFYIKSLPVPKEVETKTSTKGGWIIFGAFITVIIFAIVLFLLLAFLKN
ncbi:hypothetical protein [Mycoplasma sp. 480]|uniref:hypothetical protein n=1 Tax=Mycoplasma sp. 480 TaxID=3440155 RepID=UPI003F5125EB